MWPLVSCGEGSGDLPTVDPTRSLTATPSVTATLPTPTRTGDGPDRPTLSPTRSPTRSPTESPTETESEPPPTSTETPTTTPSPTESPTESPTPTDLTEAPSSPAVAAPTPSPSPSPTQAAEGDQEESDGSATPLWVWWLLGTVAALLAVGIPLLVRARRRGAWHEAVGQAEAEVVWFARELVPELRRTGSVERLAGGWAVSSARVVALEDRLTSLVATAPDDPARERALGLREAVRTGRARLDSLAGGQAGSDLALELDEVAEALESALRPPATPTP